MKSQGVEEKTGGTEARAHKSQNRRRKECDRKEKNYGGTRA